jgi:hypothetical protein
MYKGGKGGYSVGIYSAQFSQLLYICVGEAGKANSISETVSGGYNGGGNIITTSYGSTGGGATHIALNSNRGELKNYSNDKSAILIVAGGGGGSSCWPLAYRSIDGISFAENTGYNGGFGGGIQGGDAQGSSSNQSGNLSFYGGSQKGPGTGNIYTHPNNNSVKNSVGGFGFGGTGHGGGANSGGGGSGWYGGTGGYDNGAGAGGSGYIGGVSNGETIAGNQTIPNPNGGTETGHSGNGYCKITWHPTL